MTVSLPTPDTCFDAQPGYDYALHDADGQGDGAGLRMPVVDGARGAAISRQARDWWQPGGSRQRFMVMGPADPLIGGPPVHALPCGIRSCRPPLASFTAE